MTSATTSSLISAGVSRPEHLRELRANERGGVIGVEAVEDELLEVWDPLDSEPAAGGRLRSIGEDEQHRQRGRRPPERLEQVARKRVDPVAVLQHEDERLSIRAGPQDGGEEILERGLA